MFHPSTVRRPLSGSRSSPCLKEVCDDRHPEEEAAVSVDGVHAEAVPDVLRPDGARREDVRLREARGAAPAVIYAIQTESGPVKLGRAWDVERRLAALQNANHEALTLVWTFSFDRDVELETVVHRYFARDRIRGEW